MKLYNSTQIADILGVSMKSFYNKTSKLKIKSKKRMYTEMDLLQLENSLKTPTEIRHYPIKTHEVYYIYESKMNYNVQ